MARIKKADSDVRNLILKAEFCKTKAKEYLAEANELEVQIKSLMKDNRVNEYIVDDNSEKQLSAKVYSRISLQYDFEGIKSVLPKKVLKKVSDTMFTIEQNGLSEFLSNHPELRGELTGFIERQVNINEHKLAIALNQHLFELSDIDEFVTKKRTPVLKIQRVNTRELL